MNISGSPVAFGARFKANSLVNSSNLPSKAGVVSGGVVAVAPSIAASGLKAMSLGSLAPTVVAHPTISGLGTVASGYMINEKLSGGDDKLVDPS